MKHIISCNYAITEELFLNNLYLNKRRALLQQWPEDRLYILVSGPSVMSGWKELRMRAASAAQRCPKALLYQSGVLPLETKEKWKIGLIKSMKLFLAKSPPTAYRLTQIINLDDVLTSGRLCRCESVWTSQSRRAPAGSWTLGRWLVLLQQEDSPRALWTLKPGNRLL